MINLVEEMIGTNTRAIDVRIGDNKQCWELGLHQVKTTLWQLHSKRFTYSKNYIK